jgi:hypothetical protein
VQMIRVSREGGVFVLIPGSVADGLRFSLLRRVQSDRSNRMYVPNAKSWMRLQRWRSGVVSRMICGRCLSIEMAGKKLAAVLRLRNPKSTAWKKRNAIPADWGSGVQPTSSILHR